MRQIEPAPGERTDKPREGDHPRLTRTQAASEAGMSDHQRKQALRVANVPEDDFECIGALLPHHPIIIGTG